MTKKETIPFKLWFDSVDEMKLISNKKDRLIELFKWLDFKEIGRIDTLQLFSVVFIAVAGQPDTVLKSKS